ncbi:hypothetical protein [Marisediminicola antarctica]|uniref:Uncharacterized protein n=1 Tax=Marisediminicola antarctica TaxID=674079 RepID=A0A7L5AHC5_9MICO|nr:hypothetical protein [Marisediminicola antarctica]QHO69697.1 hypothetical protein BHD05_08635 [Marisediminicola antarctica]
MPGGNGFFPPVAYSPLWAALAVVILLVLAAFYIVVPLLTRQARVEEPEVDVSWMPVDVPALRGKYEVLISEVEASHRLGELSVRAAHQRLSLLLRLFAYESSGIRAPHMTLAELREGRDTPLSDAVAKLYPGEFEAIERGSVLDAAEVARRMVYSWN